MTEENVDKANNDTAKKGVRYLLLTVVVLGIITAGYQLVSPNKPAEVDTTASTTPTLTDGVRVYYFHGNRRCRSCIKMEEFTNDTMQENFSNELKNGQTELYVVNVDKTENNHYVDDYKLTFKTVVIAEVEDNVETNWKRLDDLWQLTVNEEKYNAYLTKEIKQMLGETHG